jgi:hypothetical protein
MEKGKRAFPRSLSRKKHDKASYQKMKMAKVILKLKNFL